MKNIIIIFAIVFFSKTIVAQQDPQYTQYFYNMNIINPAYAGTEDAIIVNFLARSQWVGIPGAPKTLTLGIHLPTGKKVGLGLSVIADKYGPVDEKNIYGDFSYSIRTGESSKFSFGLKAGVTFLDIPITLLNPENAGDNAISSNVNRVSPNFGLGFYFKNEKLRLSMSVPNILQTEHFKNGNGFLSQSREEVHSFFTAGYEFNLSETVRFVPSTLVKVIAFSPKSVDISGNFIFNSNFEIAASHRINESISGIVNFKVSNSFRIGYAYEHTLTNLGTFNSGSHEIMLLFDFKK